MQTKRYFDLKNRKKHAIFRTESAEHGVLSVNGETETAFCCETLRKNILQASNQKTPNQYEKSRAARMCPFGAHPVCMLFSGIGVPLIRIFQDAALFLFG